MNYYIVLNDGETFTALDGCKIIAVDDKAEVSLDDDFDSAIKDVANGETVEGMTIAAESNEIAAWLNAK